MEKRNGKRGTLMAYWTIYILVAVAVAVSGSVIFVLYYQAAKDCYQKDNEDKRRIKERQKSP